MVIKGVFFLFLMLTFIGCNNEKQKNCEFDEDCGLGFYCDTELGECREKTDPNGHYDKDVDPVKEDNDEPLDDLDSETEEETDQDEPVQTDEDDVIFTQCNPGEKKPCDYPENLDKVGECRAGTLTCTDKGYWPDDSECVGRVWQQQEDCVLNDKDEDCDGVVDNVELDRDEDGAARCKDGSIYDCCEIQQDCQGVDPSKINPEAIEIVGNNKDDNCNGQIDEEEDLSCDSSLSSNSEVDYAKAIGICNPVSVTITKTDGNSGNSNKGRNIVGAFGNSISKKEGQNMMILSTGDASGIFTDPSVEHDIRSPAPADWVSFHKNVFPSSKDCGIADIGASRVYDPTMVTIKVKAPTNAKSFSVNIYFLSQEFPEWVCSEYNDYFVFLLDSTFTTSDPSMANPDDKNLARDANDNFVGVNLGKSGLFKKCSTSKSNYPTYNNQEELAQYCEGYDEILGTGLVSNAIAYDELVSTATPIHGGTGWLTTRGNVVSGEEITIRLAIWDTGDALFDSAVLIDNFKWIPDLSNPGTDDR